MPFPSAGDPAATGGVNTRGEGRSIGTGKRRRLNAPGLGQAGPCGTIGAIVRDGHRHSAVYTHEVRRAALIEDLLKA